MRALLFLGALTFATTGCAILSGNPYQLESVTVGTPFERAFSDDGTSPLRGVSVDAKQRFVWSPHVPVKRPAIDENGMPIVIVERRAIICAEPSPDVLTAIANTIDTELRTKTVLTSGASVDAAARLAGTLSETVREIGERTQVIQLMRDVLYRACEAYANGALDDFGYSIILGQIDLFMLQLLSADALGRSEGGKALALAKANAAAEEAKVTKANQLLSLAEQALAQLLARDAVSKLGEVELNEAKAKLAGLRAEETALETKKNRLEVEILARKTELGKIDAQNKLVATRTEEVNTASTNVDNETDSTKKAQLQLVLNEKQRALEVETLKADALEKNRAPLEQEIGDRETELAETNARLDTLKGEIAALDARVKQGKPTPTLTAPTTAELQTAQGKVDAAREAFAAAVAERDTKLALLKQAQGDVGAGVSETKVLGQLIEFSFKGAGSLSPGRVTKTACLQWFARNPQLNMTIATDDSGPQFASDQRVPAIAVLCREVVLLSIKAGEKRIEQIGQPEPNEVIIQTSNDVFIYTND